MEVDLVHFQIFQQVMPELVQFSENFMGRRGIQTIHSTVYAYSLWKTDLMLREVPVKAIGML